MYSFNSPFNIINAYNPNIINLPNTYLPTLSDNIIINNNITALPSIYPTNFNYYNITTTPTSSLTTLNYTTYSILPENYEINDINNLSLINYTPYILSLLIDNNQNENIEIPNIGFKTIPKNSSDIITFEDIVDGDILIDFLRDTKTEYEYGIYYKESTLDAILKSKKNQFTMKPIDIKSIVKYIAKC